MVTKQLRQAIVQKGDQFGTVVLCITEEINGFGQYVPTLKKPQRLGSYETPAEARDVYETALRTFDDFGWSIVFNGPPNNAVLS